MKVNTRLKYLKKQVINNIAKSNNGKSKKILNKNWNNYPCLSKKYKNYVLETYIIKT